MTARHFVAASLLLLASLLTRTALAQETGKDAGKACRAMQSTYATIDDAARCAETHGWEVTRFWVQISDWSAEGLERGARAERGERTSTVRVMCGAPSYVEENGVRNALWETKAITRRSGYGPTTYSYNERDGVKSFAFLLDAANAACGSLHLNGLLPAPATL